MDLKSLAVDHDYYCSDCNYYSNDAGHIWDTWQDFYNEYHNADIDMNLIFRWDITADKETNNYRMQIFIIHQRKGIFAPHIIRLVQEADTPSIVSLLKQHYSKLQNIWTPLSITSKYDTNG